MSARHPASSSNAAATSSNPTTLWDARLMRHLRNRERLQSFHKLLGAYQIKLGIDRFHAQEEPVACHLREPVHVKQWMIRLRQSIQGEHSDHPNHSREQDGHLKRRYDEGRPGVIRFSADVQRIR